MPIIALTAHIYDAYKLFVLDDTLAGLFSSVLFMFYFLQYFPTMKSKLRLTLYHSTIWLMVTAGNALYICYYLRKNDRVQQIRYVAYVLLDSFFILAVWVCKMLALCSTHNRCRWCARKLFQHLNLNYHVKPHIEVRQREFFSFVSRLGAILAMLIPIFLNDQINQTKSANIGFFILFDFFYKSYYKFESVWIKLCLHLFVASLTASVATEWIYYVTVNMIYSQVSGILEVCASSCCCSLIIMNFFPSHFHQQYR